METDSGIHWKYVCLLANSVKHWPGRCVAGIELERQSNGGFVWTKRWIRPVSMVKDREEALDPEQIRIGGKRVFRPLDIAKIPFLRHAGNGIQPENWVVDSSRRWQWMGQGQLEDLLAAVDEPRDLWNEPGPWAKRDRVSPQFLASMSGLRSLYLVRPKRLHIEYSVEPLESENYPKSRRRAHFWYGGVKYNVALTDPAIDEKYFRCRPVQEGKVVIELGESLLCMSYTPKFSGFHYKIAAAILELRSS